MNIDSEYKNELVSKYRTELFENDKAGVEELDALISDEDLRNIIMLNNAEMIELINKQPVDKELVKRLLIANKNFYKIAKHRKLSIPGTSYLMPVANVVGYNTDKLYSELTVGAYYRPHRPR